MLTIRERARKDGSIGYTAIVRLKKNGRILHEEAETHPTREAAETWGKERERTLKSPTAHILARSRDTALRTTLQWLIDNAGPAQTQGRTDLCALKYLEHHEIADADVRLLTVNILVDHVRSRRGAGASPATAGNDLTALGTALNAAKDSLNLCVRPEIVAEARNRCRELQLIGKTVRWRRPTSDELQRLDGYLRHPDKRAKIPIRDILWFAIESSRSITEICGLRRDDLDTNQQTALLRDPRQGHHRRFRLTPEAWRIIECQPQLAPHIFPYNPISVGEAFWRACRHVNIQDLTFRDLQREAICRLFERGCDVPEVAQFTLLDSTATLRTYARRCRKDADLHLSWRPNWDEERMNV